MQATTTMELATVSFLALALTWSTKGGVLSLAPYFIGKAFCCKTVLTKRPVINPQSMQGRFKVWTSPAASTSILGPSEKVSVVMICTALSSLRGILNNTVRGSEPETEGN